MRTNRLSMAILGLLALLVFHARVRLSVLDPGNVGWMQTGDWPHYLQGWSFYRWDSWRFPIGYFSNLLHPVGTSTGLTDSIPWLALICKIFDPWLPRSFQYFGFYLLLCFFLQGFLGFRIMMLLSRDRLHSMLTAAFLMVAPALLNRVVHIALCSHWMVLSLILWNVSSARSPESSGVCRRKATALNLLAAVTHPYLWAMTFVMSLPLFARRWRERAEVASSFVFWTLLQIVLAVLGWWVFGYLVLGSVEEGGFGRYAGNLTGFFDSAGKTALAPQIGVIGSPGEAFDFVGLGIALIPAILLAAWVKRTVFDGGANDRTWSGPWLPSSPYFPLLVTTTGLWLFSLALFSPLFRWLGPVSGAFRASGRFSWPLYYCVVLFLLWRYRRAFPSRAATGFLLLLLGLQAYDLKPYWSLNVPVSRPIPQVGADPFWRTAGHGFRHLVLWPQGSGKLCGPNHLFGPGLVQDFIFYAAGQRMSINVGAVSRAPRAEIQAACRETRLALSEDRPEPATLYVLQPRILPKKKLASLRNFSCHEIDHFEVCAAAPFDPPRKAPPPQFSGDDECPAAPPRGVAAAPHRRMVRGQLLLRRIRANDVTTRPTMTAAATECETDAYDDMPRSEYTKSGAVQRGRVNKMSAVPVESRRQANTTSAPSRSQPPVLAGSLQR